MIIKIIIVSVMKKNVVLVKLPNIMDSNNNYYFYVGPRSIKLFVRYCLQCSVVRSANLPDKKDHSSWLSRWPCQTGSDRAY